MTERSRRRIWRERYLERVLADLPRGRMSNAAVADLVRTTWDKAFIEGRRDGADAADHYAAEREKLLAFAAPPSGTEATPLDWYWALNGVCRLLDRRGPGDTIAARELCGKMRAAAAQAFTDRLPEVAV
jgi:hypothetical protein